MTNYFFVQFSHIGHSQRLYSKNPQEKNYCFYSSYGSGSFELADKTDIEKFSCAFQQIDHSYMNQKLFADINYRSLVYYIVIPVTKFKYLPMPLSTNIQNLYLWSTTHFNSKNPNCTRIPLFTFNTRINIIFSSNAERRDACVHKNL